MDHDGSSKYGSSIGYDGYGVNCPMPLMEPLPVFPSIFEAREGSDSGDEDWGDDGDDDGDSPSTPSSCSGSSSANGVGVTFPALGPTTATGSRTDASNCHGTNDVHDSDVSEVNRLVDEAMECGPQRARAASPSPSVRRCGGSGDDEEDEYDDDDDDDDDEFLRVDVIITGEVRPISLFLLLHPLLPTSPLVPRN